MGKVAADWKEEELQREWRDTTGEITKLTFVQKEITKLKPIR